MSKHVLCSPSSSLRAYAVRAGDVAAATVCPRVTAERGVSAGLRDAAAAEHAHTLRTAPAVQAAAAAIGDGPAADALAFAAQRRTATPCLARARAHAAAAVDGPSAAVAHDAAFVGCTLAPRRAAAVGRDSTALPLRAASAVDGATAAVSLETTLARRALGLRHATAVGRDGAAAALRATSAVDGATAAVAYGATLIGPASLPRHAAAVCDWDSAALAVCAGPTILGLTTTIAQDTAGECGANQGWTLPTTVGYGRSADLAALALTAAERLAARIGLDAAVAQQTLQRLTRPAASGTAQAALLPGRTGSAVVVLAAAVDERAALASRLFTSLCQTATPFVT